jgi:hypothetical protein
LAAALFPIFQRRQWDAVDTGEFLLGHPQLFTDGAHIGHFDCMNSGRARLAFGVFAAWVRLSISSLLNLFMLSLLTPVRRLQPRYKPLYRALRIRQEVIAPCLRIDHQQVKRHRWIMVEVNDAVPASLAAALSTPADLTDATACRDNVTGLGVARYEIDELEPLVIVPKRAGLAHEHSRFRYRNRPHPHQC